MAKTHQQFFRFCVVGASGTALDFGLLLLLVELFAWHPIPAATVSFLAAVANNFYWNRQWTFEAHGQAWRPQLLLFVFVSLVGLGLNLLFLKLFLVFHIWYVLGKACATIFVVFWNFFANRAWTFALASSSQTGEENIS